MPENPITAHLPDGERPVERAPLLLRYGLWLTALVYGIAALTLTESPLGPPIVFQLLYYSIAISAIVLWFRPDLTLVRRYHVVVPTALITIGGAEQVRILLATVSHNGEVLLAVSGLIGLIYIGVVQYVFLPLSILHKAGPT